ncbi:ribosomal protein S5 domain 2-type protein [Spinellus fusiger]|nr:ribosomal protein S5 domain 2-type protein [Spinellus fusiger]
MFRHVTRSSASFVGAARRETQYRLSNLRQAKFSSLVHNNSNKGVCGTAGQRLFWQSIANYSTTTPENQETEVITGSEETYEFKTETKSMLRIVANSLYSEKEIFIRELISNAADALEKLKHLQSTETVETEHPLEIRIALDTTKKIITIQDTGIGMTLEELNDNLGTIARSGSKNFLEKLEKEGGGSRENIIGQFGVGFYSTFMVGDRIKVYTRSAKPGSKGYCWSTDGQGSYTVAEAANVAVGTKIVIHLRDDCKSFASHIEVESIIKKYSNFVGFPIHLGDSTVNTVEPLWTKDTKSITQEQHQNFYRFIASAWDSPQYSLHFKTDAPISIASVLYVPERHMESMGNERMGPGVSLYSRKVLIQPKSKGILPEWMRFVKGVVDSEDIPLNVSRELLQDNILNRLRKVMTTRVLKWLENEAKKDEKKYTDFFLDFGQFIKEGVCTDAMHKENIAKLLRFESSTQDAGTMTSLKDYTDRMKEGQKSIYYLLTTKRKYAEDSPYSEMFKKNGVELLYMYDTVDEFVVNHLSKFQKLNLVSADSPEAASDPLLQRASSTDVSDGTALSETEAKTLAEWVEISLGPSVVKKVDVSHRLEKFPAVVLEHESPAMQRMIRMMEGSAKLDDIPSTPTRLEINPDHTIMRGIFHMRDAKPEFAKMITRQVYDNALCAAGVLEDPRSMVSRLNELMEISVMSVLEQEKKVKAPENK